MSRTDWFTQARFGMFIHWGLYAIPAAGEWIFARRDWKDGEYQSLMKQFNPVDYDPAEWAALAKAAGVLGHYSMRNGNVPADVPPLREELIRYFDGGQKK